ncbi:MAG TPA: biotin transporter BioY [Acidobacteriaceae bacterium]|nr:biotin transporter BioY [Acidobacteriaceae bacterium]
MNPAASTSATPGLPRSFVLPALARRAFTVVLGSLFVAVCAHIAFPLWFTPVPVTLQTFAVLLLGLVLSPGMAASALVLYLIEGMAGLPVLAPAGSIGFLHIFGPTGGYLLSYPAAAALTSFLRRRVSRMKSARGGFAVSAFAAAVGSAVILLSGAVWFGTLTHQPAMTVLAMTVAPFLAGDTLKVIAAAGAASGLRRFRRS